MSSKFTCSFRCIDVVTVVGLLMLTVTIGQAAELNPAAVIYKLPDQIEWKGTGGNRSAVLVGDPEKPGLYVVINKWLKGTWWVGTGNKFDPANTVPMPAGTFVTHFGKQVHWDGAKDEDAIILIVGEGPATITRVEEAK